MDSVELHVGRNGPQIYLISNDSCSVSECFSYRTTQNSHTNAVKSNQDRVFVVYVIVIIKNLIQLLYPYYVTMTPEIPRSRFNFIMDPHLNNHIKPY